MDYNKVYHLKLVSDNPSRSSMILQSWLNDAEAAEGCTKVNVEYTRSLRSVIDKAIDGITELKVLGRVAMLLANTYDEFKVEGEYQAGNLARVEYTLLHKMEFMQNVKRRVAKYSISGSNITAAIDAEVKKLTDWLVRLDEVQVPNRLRILLCGDVADEWEVKNKTFRDFVTTYLKKYHADEDTDNLDQFARAIDICAMELITLAKLDDADVFLVKLNSRGVRKKQELQTEKQEEKVEAYKVSQEKYIWKLDLKVQQIEESLRNPDSDKGLSKRTYGQLQKAVQDTKCDNGWLLLTARFKNRNTGRAYYVSSKYGAVTEGLTNALIFTDEESIEHVKELLLQKDESTLFRTVKVK